MCADEIIDRMKCGEELICRGNGWYLSNPYKPYTRRVSVKVEDRVVDDMVSRGILKIEEKGWSFKAVLCS